MGRRRKTAQSLRFRITAAVRAWRSWLPDVALVAMVAVAYYPAFSGGWVLDDDAYVTNNSQLRSVNGLEQIWLHPLEHTSQPDRYNLLYTMFWVEYHLWGNSPLGFHAVNIALHAACAILLWRLLKRLNVPGAWLAAAIFSVHPVCVESVAWVTEGKNTLSLLFALLCVLCYLRFSPGLCPGVVGNFEKYDSRITPGQSPGLRRYYVLSLVFFAAALLSKTQIVALPLVLLIIYWWKRGRVDWPIVKPLMPFFALALAFAWLTVFIETQFNGASAADYSLPMVSRLLVAAQATWFYVGKLILPHALSFIYPRWTINSGAWMPYLFLFAAIQTLVALWLARNAFGRGPLAATLIFICLLLPVLGFFNVCFYRFSYVADHFQYHAAVAMFALFAAMAATMFKKSFQWLRRVPNSLVIKVLPAAALGFLAFLSWKQSQLYAGPETIYADTLEKNPTCWMAHNNLANALKERGDFATAIEHYHEALRLKPDYVEAHVDLGYALVCTNLVNDAIAEFQEAIRLKPGFATAYSNLGSALTKQGKLTQAIECYQQAIQLNPDLAAAQITLGMLLLKQGNARQAIVHLRQGVNLAPDCAEAHGNLGAALATCGQLERAIAEYRDAVRLNPKFVQAQYNLAIALLETNRAAESIPYFRATLRLNSGDLQCAKDLANACALAHRPAEALEAAENAGKLARSNGQMAEAEQIQAFIASLQRTTSFSR